MIIVAVERAVARRAAALRGLRRVKPRATLRRLTAALDALPAAATLTGPVARANADYLRTALDLELELITAIRDSAVLRADAAYQRLVAHHDTEQASRAALLELPAAVRGFGSDPVSGPISPLIFVIPFSVLGRHLTAAMPALLSCPHGLLSAGGTCRTPPCPAQVPLLNVCSEPDAPEA